MWGEGGCGEGERGGTGREWEVGKEWGWGRRGVGNMEHEGERRRYVRKSYLVRSKTLSLS